MSKKKIKLETGDILAIDLENNEYAFARVLSKVSIGHCIEIFDFIGRHPDQHGEVDFESRLMMPQIIDSHSLFWLRKEGNWELQAKQKEFVPPQNEPTKFEYGDKSNLKLVDIFGNVEPKGEDDDGRYAPYIPKGDIQIKKIIKFWRDKKGSS